MQARLVIYLICLVTALGTYLGAYLYGRHAEGIKRDKIALEAIVAGQKKLNEAILANDQLKMTLEAEHAKANAVINTILDRPAPGVRLKFLSAPDCVQTQAASGNSAPIQSTGALLAEAERILGEDRQRTRSIVAEAERELTDCRVVKEWAAH